MTETRIKIIAKNNSKELNDEVNNYLESLLTEFVVVDIKFNVQATVYGSLFSVMIITDLNKGCRCPDNED